MTMIELKSTITRGLHTVGFQIKKHSPEILIGAGVIGVTSAAVMACRATTKLKAVMDETAESIEAIHFCEEKGYTIDPDTGNKIDYTAEDSKKDLTIAYAQTAFKLVKLYAPSVILGAASLGCIITSNHIHRERHAALAAAYVAVDKSYKAYRGRVVERFGKELDKELRYGIKAQEVEETVVNDKGKEKTVKKTINTVNPQDLGDYTVIFDETCRGWVKDAEQNKLFLLQQQNWANEKLKAQGHLFLNEVFDMVGHDRTKMGNVVGWMYNPENPDADGFVDFGIYSGIDEAKSLFINGRERSIILDFNVDGPIWDLL